ncbi:MAG: DUF881 domain-containing protein [Nocardioidaceae bacterium]
MAQGPRSGKRTPAPGRLRRWLADALHGRSLWWRLSVPLACACAGLLAMTSMVNAHGTDLRAGRSSTSLVEVVSQQRHEVQSLRAETRQLQAQVDQLSTHVKGGGVDKLQAKLNRMEQPVGLQAVSGSGLVVTLDDAPRGEAESDTDIDPNLLVVHQQDIQAVVNALWAGGAEAISLEGKRIITTTGIKCVGNTVVLQGVPYSPPYDIVAIGDPTKLYDALLASPEVQNYRDYVGPPYNLGWSLRSSNDLDVPAHAAPLALNYAEPLHH